MADIQHLFNQFLAHPDVVEHPGHSGEAKAWCPWHEDRAGGNPSLGINVNKRIVKCFVCGKGGASELAKAWDIDLNTDVPPWERPVLRTHNYNNPDGTLRFQSVKFTDSSWSLRRPDASRPDGWAWNMKGTQSVLYRLDELRAANPEEWVYIVEGEKDVDRLRDLGLVATTNPMGAKNWRAYFNKELKGRKVAVIPDNDEAGRDHVAKVAKGISSLAKTVKILALAGAPDKGDISDWLDDGHTPEDLHALLAATPSYTPPAEDETSEAGQPEWKLNPQRTYAVMITDRLLEHGFFVNGGAAGSFYFDQRTKELVALNKDNIEFKSLLSDHYQINPKDNLFGVLLEHLLVEAFVRGQLSELRMFSNYDRESNTAYLEMGKGRVLKITPDSIEVRDNGQDGVLFLPTPKSAPWEYRPDAPEHLVYNTLVKNANFTEDGQFTVEQQKLLLLLWIVSVAFESMMMFRPIALAVGPGASGKSSLFRYIGRMLIGPKFDVYPVKQDSKGEEGFWVAVTNSAFVAWDNVDQLFRWLPDALATVVTGVAQPKREFFTTNKLVEHTPHCMLAVTARTPTISLRREDIAGRVLPFSMGPLSEIREEFEIHDEIVRLRDQLMSDYARMIQKTLAVPLASVKVADKTLRLADFARIVTRIGMGMGPQIAERTDEVIKTIRSAQNQFATEENDGASLLELWIVRTKPREDGAMDLGAEANNGREVLAKDLLKELQAIAKEYGGDMPFNTPATLGRWLKNMDQALSKTYIITSGRNKKGAWVKFKVRDDAGVDEQETDE